MIPLKDNIPTDRFPVITVAFIVINIAFFIWQLGFPTDKTLEEEVGFKAVDQSALEYGAIPYRITHPGETEDCAVGAVGKADSQGQFEAGVICPGTEEYEQAVATAQENPGSDLAPIAIDQAPWYVTVFTSMFMHGGFLHIGFNMLFLWVFGNNIEDSMGRAKFVGFYLAAGLVAVYTQALIDVTSTVPTIGASGAVAGVLGAYALLHPSARVLTLIFIIFFVTIVEIPALILLGIWFILQFIPAVADATSIGAGEEGGVAYLAHVGGFLFGLATIKLLANKRRDPEPPLPVY